MSLAGDLESYCGEIEADLQRYYRVDLVDLWRGLLSYRKLAVLIDGLPAESRFRTRMRNEAPRYLVDDGIDEGPMVHGPWTLADQLLARIGDALQMMRYEASDRKQKPPPQYPRPGVDEVKRLTRKDFEMLEQLRENHGAIPTTE